MTASARTCTRSLALKRSYISNIGEVIFTAYVKTAIQIARSAYDSLTDEQKELVTRYQTLIEAEETWARLEAENEVTEEDMDMAAEVDLLIDAIGDVTADSGSAIQAARLAFDSLTEKQQSLVSHPETLIGAEEVYNKLRASEGDRGDCGHRNRNSGEEGRDLRCPGPV